MRAMTSKALIDKIDALPPEKREALERYVEQLSAPGAAASDEWLVRVREHRERLRQEYGLIDSASVLREMREDGE